MTFLLSHSISIAGVLNNPGEQIHAIFINCTAAKLYTSVRNDLPIDFPQSCGCGRIRIHSGSSGAGGVYSSQSMAIQPGSH
jgi:hypothetical protein